jgi:ATP-dependent DNA ligase
MLAELRRELPAGDWFFEPKWDGFRALCARDGDAVEIHSRHGRPLARYFPEVVDALRRVDANSFVIDGELVPRDVGRGFAALMMRLHPAESRTAQLSVETPADLVAFDLLRVGDEDLLPMPFHERRARLESVLADAPTGVALSPVTRDPAVAAAWLGAAHPGIDGVMVKDPVGPYLPGRRAMVKVKRERTADCVVAGFRVLAGVPRVGSLLLGLYGTDGDLRHVGVATGFSEARRTELLETLTPLIATLESHPWEAGFGLGRSPLGRLPGAAGRWDPAMTMDWVPVAPDLVAEVAYTAADGERFRHPARFRRWRPDRDPRSCTFDQLEGAARALP